MVRDKTHQRFSRKVADFFERGIFAPFLFSIQPVLQLYLININEIDFSEIIRALFVAFLLGCIVIGLAYLLLHDRLKAALVSSLFLLLFFFFGDFVEWFSTISELGPARRDALVFMIVALCMFVWLWLVQRRIKDLLSVNMYFNLLSIFFIINSGIQMRSHLIENSVSLNPSDRTVPVTTVASGDPRPDIYYIILDAYGREDVLKALYGFDNSEFVDSLKDRGFYIADESYSNYIYTLHSVSSSLNMDYLQNLQVNDRDLENRADLIEILNYSRVRTELAQNGYQMVSFKNDYKATISTADIYYGDPQSGLFKPVTAFESIVISGSMARILLHIPAVNKAIVESPYDTHRAYITSTFDRLKDIPMLDGNYFVHAHIIAPHPPFVFDKDGTAILHSEPFTLLDGNYYLKIKGHSRKGYISDYRKQLQYINTLVLDAVDAILSESKTPPIIIIQADHGPGSHLHLGSLEQTLTAERFGILNAYYFPDQNYESLYPSISPVNSFRVVINQFFGGDYELLPDKHYYSKWNFPFDFVQVTELSLPQ
ncbi:MAG TPA: hypothetical protein VJ987_06720 [Anaerolineales bacterium]|nr:hypothetical protein [Anaerolineales bacterium]